MTLRQTLTLCVQQRVITQKQAERILNKGIQSTCHGSPLLHLLCKQVDATRQEQCRYLKAALSLMRAGADPNAIDSYGRSALYYAVRSGKNHLTTHLIEGGANPHSISRRGQSALALALYHVPENRALIHYLHAHTLLNETILKEIQQGYDTAIACWYQNEKRYVNRIELCLELQLTQKAVRPNDCPLLEQGLWIRCLSQYIIDSEIAILDRRQNLPPSELVGCRTWTDEDSTPTSTYTLYSPATFVISEIPTMLFGFYNMGVIIKRLNRPIDYFYDGYSSHEQLTCDFDFSTPQGLDHRGLGQLHHCSEDEIIQAVQAANQTFINRWYHRADRYGAIVDSEHMQPWNEGLFRYQKSDIVGIHVDPDRKETVQRGLYFRSCLAIQVPFYHYESGAMQSLDISALMQQYHLNEDGSPITPPASPSALLWYETHVSNPSSVSSSPENTA